MNTDKNMYKKLMQQICILLLIFAKKIKIPISNSDNQTGLYMYDFRNNSFVQLMYVLMLKMYQLI